MDSETILRCQVRKMLVRDKRLPIRTRYSVFKSIMERQAHLQSTRMTLSDVLEAEIQKRLNSPSIGICLTAKEIVQKHLSERKLDPRKRKVSEHEVAEALGILERFLSTEPEIKDLFYNLSDLSPFDRVKQHAAEAIRQLKR